MNPPERVEVRWCPECGQNDRHGTMGETAHKHARDGGWCYAKPKVIVYKRARREGE